MRVASCHLVSSNIQDTGFNLAIPVPKTPVAIASGTLSGSFVAPPQYVHHMYDMNYQVIVTGTVATPPTGTLTIQQSNDSESPYYNAAPSPYGVVNWTNVATVAVTGSVDFAVNLQQQAMKWLRLNWAHTAGTGSMDVYFVAKGAGF